MTREIVAKECKFVMHKPARYEPMIDKWFDDVHFVKEIIRYSDGSIEPNLLMLHNYERPFWITAEPFRRYKDKKESESEDRLRKFFSTESFLWGNIGKRLKAGTRERRVLSQSPYVYGADVSADVFIKNDYITQWPGEFNPSRVATLDIENDVDTDQLYMISVAREGEVYTVILKDYIKREADAINRLHKLFKENIPLEEEVKVEYKILDTEIELFVSVMNKVHEWKPDFLAIWNMDYEVSYFIELCKRYEVKIEDIISDPSVPKEYRFFKYKRSPDSKVSASGVRKATDPQDKWNVVYSPSYFYWVDAMSAYNYVRVNTKKVPTGYSLDSILNHELGSKFKKLKFPHLAETDLLGADYHRWMVNNHRLEYIIYNQWDVLSMIVLEKKTKDLTVSMPTLCDISSYTVFDSGPKKIIDGLLFEYLKEGRVLGVKDISNHGEDLEHLGLKDWIITLPNRRLAEQYGSKISLQYPDLPTNVREHVYDSDQTSGYPNDIRQGNVSGDTTLRTIIGIEGLDKDYFKRENINLLFGPVSQVQYCESMMNFPTLFELDGAVTKLLREKKSKEDI